MDHTATYSPEDNKIRIYPAYRLPESDYSKLKESGFKWAPKQELFVAPMWTPERADIAEELAGEIGDEDTGLVSRAEDRADRFKDYSESRANDAAQAHKSVSAICDGIPLGQPILIGHHSEKRARKDAQRIENGMRKAIKMWETSEYWKQRAAGAIRAAKYKERPDVRARRIRGLEADKRKQEKYTAEAEKFLKLWERLEDDSKWITKAGDLLPMIERAKYIANFDNISKCFSLTEYPAADGVHAYEGAQSLWSALDGGRITAEQARDIAINSHQRGILISARWIEHYANRIEYERAMLGESGGTVADKVEPEKGGACRCWATAHVSGAWSNIVKVNKVSVTVYDNWGNGGENFTRTIPFDKLTKIMSAAEVKAARDAGKVVELSDGTGFVLLDTAPATTEKAESPTTDKCVDFVPLVNNGDYRGTICCKCGEKEKDHASAQDFSALRDQLKSGIQVVTAPQLFPTPKELAKRMADLADVQPGDRVLEPSAGTGMLLGALGGKMFSNYNTRPYKERNQVHAVEINTALAGRLQAEFPLTEVHNTDFLSIGIDEFEHFDIIVMNPPFANGQDIAHILHAKEMLKPGGRLVAICAGGPRQREALSTIGKWEDLPSGTFKEAGTNVSCALVVIDNV